MLRETMLRTGTCFLPSQFSPSETTPPETTQRPGNGALRVATILIVEDDILIRMAAADHLRDAGYRILEAGNGDEARTLLRANEPIEVVFSDVNMPGLDGLSLALWIDREFPDVKVVLTSGEPANAAAARAVAIFLPKPYSFAELSRIMKELLSV
jgi:DNA-binding NtrC family response regulator